MASVNYDTDSDGTLLQPDVYFWDSWVFAIWNTRVNLFVAAKLISPRCTDDTYTDSFLLDHTGTVQAFWVDGKCWRGLFARLPQRPYLHTYRAVTMFKPNGRAAPGMCPRLSASGAVKSQRTPRRDHSAGDKGLRRSPGSTWAGTPGEGSGSHTVEVEIRSNWTVKTD